MSTAPTPIPFPYTLRLKGSQVDLILHGLFCLVRNLPNALDSAAPGSQAEQNLLDLTEQATDMIEWLVELPGITHAGGIN